MNPHLCVCSHPPDSHLEGVGQCQECGCSYVLRDCGIEPVTITPPTEPYAGIYAKKGGWEL